MKTCLVLLVLALVGIMLVDFDDSSGKTSSSSSPGGVPAAAPPVAPPPVAGPRNSWERVLDMLGHAGDFFEGYAEWEHGMVSGLMSRASRPLQALTGVVLCIRDILILLGLYALLTVRRLLGRFGG